MGNVRFEKTKKQPYKRIHKNGYWVLHPKMDGKAKDVKIHRLVAECWIDPASEEILEICKSYKYPVPHVNHIDGNKLNNLPENLEWCTREQNTKHAWENNLNKGLAGSTNGRATIDEELVHELCKEFEKGMTPKEATERYPVSKQQASKIRAGIQWKHIVSQYNIPKLKNRSKKFNG